MNRTLKLTLLTTFTLGAVLTLAVADSPPSGADARKPRTNSYYLYTGALDVDESGVAAIPTRFRWSVETSWSGLDAQGANLPDSRIMLRLYDPDHNFTALTAQMDLATATRLHHELGEIIIKKLRDPNFQHRPQLYSSDKIPRGRIVGVNAEGEAIIELSPPPAARRKSPPGKAQ